MKRYDPSDFTLDEAHTNAGVVVVVGDSVNLKMRLVTKHKGFAHLKEKKKLAIRQIHTEDCSGGINIKQ